MTIDRIISICIVGLLIYLRPKRWSWEYDTGVDRLKIMLRLILGAVSLLYIYSILNYLFADNPNPNDYYLMLVLYTFAFIHIPALVILIIFPIWRLLINQKIPFSFRTDLWFIALSLATLIINGILNQW